MLWQLCFCHSDDRREEESARPSYGDSSPSAQNDNCTKYVNRALVKRLEKTSFLGCLADLDEHGVERHALAGLNVHAQNDAAARGADLIFHLHGFQHNHGLAGRHLLARLD